MASPQTTRSPRNSLAALFVHADATLDWDGIAAFHANPTTSRNKSYSVASVCTSLAEAWENATTLGLVDRSPLRVLDIGPGGGAFAFVCRYLGHDVETLDLPDARDNHTTVRKSMGVDAIPHRITPRGRLPRFDRRFDMVTAFRIQFDTKGTGVRWGPAEWTFFLEDVRNNVLVEGGTLALYPRLPEANREVFAAHNGHLVNDKKKLLLFRPLT